MNNAFTVQDGMDVFGTDGEKIGSVSHVYRHVPGPAGTGLPASGLEIEEVVVADSTGVTEVDEIDTARTMDDEGGNGYIEVAHGGVLGLGATHLYVPFSAIQDVQPGECATLSCTKAECNELYAQKPAALESVAGGS